MKKYLSFFILFFFTFCFSQEEYLRQLKKKIEFNINHNKPLKNISDAEEEKFTNTKDSIYYVSHKYALIFFLGHDEKNKIKHFIALTDLLRANRNRFSIVTTDVYFAMATQLENYSQDMSFDYINKSIENEEKTVKSRSLPHLYHFKGRLYYNIGNYDKSLEYFKKALLLYLPEEYLYISSMHNNFGLVYEEQKKTDKAIQEYKIARNILLEKKQLTEEDSSFLLKVTANLAKIYIANKMTTEGKVLFENLFNQNKNIPERANNVVNISTELYQIYKRDNDKVKISLLIDFLKNAEKQNLDLSTKISILEILTDYYFENKQYDEAKSYHLKTIHFKDLMIAENNKIMNELGDSLNKTIIKNTNQQYDYKIKSQKTQTLWIVLFSIIIISTLVYFFTNTIKKRKREREISSQQKTISEQNELHLQQNMKLQEEKIRNLHLNLHIKQKTAKAFLEKIKKARKTRSDNSEEILKDLYFELNNLINIDKKNIDFTEQNSVENQNFVKKISLLYPNLSQLEIQLCVYFRLNLSAKEISMLEKISDGTVRVYKSKIKSKMGIGKQKNIEEVLNTI